jgi:hypothetical protein
VSCWSSDGCVVAGTIPRMPVPGEPSPPPGNDFLYWWDGTALVAGTAIPGTRDVACTFPKRCVAVRGEQTPLLFSDSEQREPPLPPANGDPAPELTMATCTTDVCLATGHTGQGSTMTPVVYRWNFGPYR